MPHRGSVNLQCPVHRTHILTGPTVDADAVIDLDVILLVEIQGLYWTHVNTVLAALGAFFTKYCRITCEDFTYVYGAFCTLADFLAKCATGT